MNLEEELRATYEKHDAAYDPSESLARLRHGGYESVRRPWYRRVRGVRRRTQGLALVLAGLVVAAPAVGAVSNWFGIGAPEHAAPSSPTLGSGAPLPGTDRLMPLRVRDPQGGPPWGVRVMRTTRGDTCVQVGRVEDGTIGSLGIDHLWHDDGLFHAFPSNTTPDLYGSNCAATDGAGHGFANLSFGGLPSSASWNPNTNGKLGPGCLVGVGNERPPRCPTGSARFVFAGLLGPDATSITYKAPDGSLQTEKTVGRDGAYLLVFRSNKKTCNLYQTNLSGVRGDCSNSAGAMPSPGPVGAIESVTYSDGHTCHVKPAAPKHLSRAALMRYELGEVCPPVGYVATKAKHVTAADVATPIKVRLSEGRHWCLRGAPYRPNTLAWKLCDGAVPTGYTRVNPPHPLMFAADVSLVARVPVTSSRSWYQISFRDRGRLCGTGGELGDGDVRAGEKLRFQITGSIGRQCPGVDRGASSGGRSVTCTAPRPSALWPASGCGPARTRCWSVT